MALRSCAFTFRSSFIFWILTLYWRSLFPELAWSTDGHDSIRCSRWRLCCSLYSIAYDLRGCKTKLLIDDLHQVLDSLLLVCIELPDPTFGRFPFLCRHGWGLRSALLPWQLNGFRQALWLIPHRQVTLYLEKGASLVKGCPVLGRPPVW